MKIIEQSTIYAMQWINDLWIASDLSYATARRGASIGPDAWR
jgi:hypothetical protein